MLTYCWNDPSGFKEWNDLKLALTAIYSSDSIDYRIRMADFHKYFSPIMKILLNYEYTAVLNAKNFYLKVDLWYKLTFTTK